MILILTPTIKIMTSLVARETIYFKSFCVVLEKKITRKAYQKTGIYWIWETKNQLPFCIQIFFLTPL